MPLNTHAHASARDARLRRSRRCFGRTALRLYRVSCVVYRVSCTVHRASCIVYRVRCIVDDTNIVRGIGRCTVHGARYTSRYTSLMPDARCTVNQDARCTMRGTHPFLSLSLFLALVLLCFQCFLVARRFVYLCAFRWEKAARNSDATQDNF